MQYNVFFPAALTAFFVGVDSLALPVNDLAASEPCGYSAVKQDQSRIFGYQLVGVARSPSDNEQTCNELKNPATTTNWVDSGLVVASIAEPVCSASSSNMVASDALPYIANASSDVFTTLITSAFPASNKDAFTFLCDNIRFKLLSAFFLDENTIVDATCKRGGPDAHLNPQPFTPLAPDPADSVLNEYNVAASRIFAWNWCAGANDMDELRSYCSITSQDGFRQRLNALQLVPSAVRQVVCSQDQVPSGQTLAARVRDATSDAFATVVKNMSNAPLWTSNICGWLSCAAMDKVGLDGQRVWDNICRK